MVFFGDNGPKITTQSFKLPKQHFKTKLQGFKKSGQKCHVRYAHIVMSVTLYLSPTDTNCNVPLLFIKSAFIFKVGSHEVFKTKPRFTEPQNSQKL